MTSRPMFIRNKTIKQYSVTISKRRGELSTRKLRTLQLSAWFSQQLHNFAKLRV